MSQPYIIIPCFNEEKRLPLNEYQTFLTQYNYPLVFVNDGSTDNTLQVLHRLQNNFPEQVAILDLKKNVGKAEAIRKGILEVTAQKKVDIIGFMDADLATPFNEIDYFMDAFRDTRLEFVFGSRIARIGAHIQRYQARHYFGRIMATLVSNYLALPVNDSQCGAKFFHAPLARQLFKEPFVSRWLFDVEIFKRLLLLGKEVEACALELPLHTWIEKGGSKLSITDFLKLPFEFYKIMAYYSEKRNSNNLFVLYQDYSKSNWPAMGPADQ